MAVPQDRALARARVDQHDRELVRGPHDRSRRGHVDAFADQPRRGQPPELVVAKATDVAGTPAEPRAGHQGRRRLSPGEARKTLKLLLAVPGGKLSHDGQQVNAVQPESGDIEWPGAPGWNLERDAHRAMLAQFSQRWLTFAFLLRIVRDSGLHATTWRSTMLPLTKRQREILDYLNEFIQQHGYAPCLEEIGRRFGLSSLAPVHKHLTNLQEKGFIKRAW